MVRWSTVGRRWELTQPRLKRQSPCSLTMVSATRPPAPATVQMSLPAQQIVSNKCPQHAYLGPSVSCLHTRLQYTVLQPLHDSQIVPDSTEVALPGQHEQGRCSRGDVTARYHRVHCRSGAVDRPRKRLCRTCYRGCAWGGKNPRDNGTAASRDPRSATMTATARSRIHPKSRSATVTATARTRIHPRSRNATVTPQHAQGSTQCRLTT